MYLFCLGECWSGDESHQTFDRYGASNDCRGQNFDECPCNSYHCVGMARTNYVYRLIAPPKVVQNVSYMPEIIEPTLFIN